MNRRLAFISRLFQAKWLVRGVTSRADRPSSASLLVIETATNHRADADSAASLSLSLSLCGRAETEMTRTNEDLMAGDYLARVYRAYRACNRAHSDRAFPSRKRRAYL